MGGDTHPDERRAAAKANRVWKPCGYSAQRTEWEGERVDRLRTERHPSVGITGDWKATALNAEVRFDTVTGGGRRFMVAWGKYEVDEARHRQERERTRLGKFLSHTVA